MKFLEAFGLFLNKILLWDHETQFTNILLVPSGACVKWGPYLFWP